MRRIIAIGIGAGVFFAAMYWLLRRNQFQRNAKQEFFRMLLGAWLAFLCAPAFLVDNGYHETNLTPFRMIAMYGRVLQAGNIRYFIVNLIGNVFIFAPIGFLLPCCSKKRGFWRTIGIGFGVSLSIELIQLALPRCSDVDDLLLNTLGTALGYGLYILVNILRKGKLNYEGN